MKKALLVLFVLMLALCLTSCGGDAEEVGSYTLDSMSENGETMSMKDLKDMYDAYGMDMPEFSLTLNKDGTGKMVVMGETKEITWDAKAKTMNISALPYLHSLFPDAPIAIHEDDACYLGEDAAALHLSDFSGLGLTPYVRNYFEQEGSLPAATLLLKDGDVLPFAPEWNILHTPGHSPGSICLYNESEKTLFSGDTIFAGGGIGRFDLRGGNYSKLMESVSRLKKLPHGTKVLPGHGENTYVE